MKKSQISNLKSQNCGVAMRLFLKFLVVMIILGSGCVLSPLEYDEEKNWTTYLVNSSNPYSNTFNIIITSDGKLWTGTEGGVNMFDGKKWTTYTTKNGLGSNIIYSLALGEDGVWAGSNRGLYFFNYSLWKKVDSIKENYLVEVLSYHNGILWVGTNNGLFRLDSKGDIIDKFDNIPGSSISSIVFDDENVWVGTDRGLGRFRQGIWTTYTSFDGLISNAVKSLATDGKLLWVGTGSGLNRFEIFENKWTDYTTSQNTDKKLVDNDILALALIDDILLVGSAGGLNKFDGRVWLQIAPEEIPHVLCLAVQGSTVWVGTKNGLLKGKI